MSLDAWHMCTSCGLFGSAQWVGKSQEGDEIQNFSRETEAELETEGAAVSLEDEISPDQIGLNNRISMFVQETHWKGEPMR